MGTKIWSGNRERGKEIGIGIILSAVVVVVAAEDITMRMRGMVRIVIVVVVMGMGGRLMNGGDDCDSYLLAFLFFLTAQFFL